MRELILTTLANAIEIPSAMALLDCVDAKLRKKTNARAFQQMFDQMVIEGAIRTCAHDFDEEPALLAFTAG